LLSEKFIRHANTSYPSRKNFANFYNRYLLFELSGKGSRVAGFTGAMIHRRPPSSGGMDIAISLIDVRLGINKATQFI
jgi:hypothetical protein